MRAHQVAVRAAAASIAEDKRLAEEEIYNDPLVQGFEVATGVTESLAVGQKYEDWKYRKKMVEAEKLKLKEESPEIYENIWGDIDRRKEQRGGLLDRIGKGLFGRKDEPVINNSGFTPSEPSTGIRGKIKQKRINKQQSNWMDIPEEQTGAATTYMQETAPGEYTEVDINTLPAASGSFKPSKYTDIAGFIGDLEGIDREARYDVNAWRIGYGTDTIYTAKGDSIKVKKGDKITDAEAKKQLDLDLEKRFRPELRNKFGKDYYDSLPLGVRAALESLAYNAGSDLNDKDGSITAAIKEGDFNKAANLIESSVPANHTLANRRRKEAAMMRSAMDEVYTQGLSQEKAEWWMSANDDAAQLFGFEDTDEYRQYMRENIISYDENGNTIINQKVYDKLNSFIDESANYIKQTQLGQMIKQYNKIVTEEANQNVGVAGGSGSGVAGGGGGGGAG